VILLALISVQLAQANDPPIPDGHGNAMAQPWWSESDAAWMGGGAGGVIGILGAVFGIVAGMGIARRFIVTLALGMFVFGVIVLLAGMIALANGQPYHVYYPLLLLGGISSFVFGFNYPFLKRRYEQIELQRMSAMDA